MELLFCRQLRPTQMAAAPTTLSVSVRIPIPLRLSPSVDQQDLKGLWPFLSNISTASICTHTCLGRYLNARVTVLEQKWQSLLSTHFASSGGAEITLTAESTNLRLSVPCPFSNLESSTKGVRPNQLVSVKCAPGDIKSKPKPPPSDYS